MEPNAVESGEARHRLYFEKSKNNKPGIDMDPLCAEFEKPEGGHFNKSSVQPVIRAREWRWEPFSDDPTSGAIRVSASKLSRRLSR
jgi:hypothetical protein